MEPAKPVSTPRIVLKWAMMLGVIIFFSGIGYWCAIHPGYQTQRPENSAAESAPAIVRMFILFFVGALFLAPGVVGYLIAILTCCLTFNYQRPVWSSVKVKVFFANILVLLTLGLGIGFMVAGLLSPFLRALGLIGVQADILPVIGVLIGVQMLQLWVLIWSPVERLVIARRLKTMGIAAEQLKGATLIGVSNADPGAKKQFGAIEEDMGALWVTPERLAFRGDVEQFDLARDHIVQIERRAHGRSTTALAGIAHVILHVRTEDGTVRQMRLHVEGLWTMGRKRRVMNDLAALINEWYGVGAGAHPMVSGH